MVTAEGTDLVRPKGQLCCICQAVLVALHAEHDCCPFGFVHTLICITCLVMHKVELS